MKRTALNKILRLVQETSRMLCKGFCNASLGLMLFPSPGLRQGQGPGRLWTCGLILYNCPGE